MFASSVGYYSSRDTSIARTTGFEGNKIRQLWSQGRLHIRDILAECAADGQQRSSSGLMLGFVRLLRGLGVRNGEKRGARRG